MVSIRLPWIDPRLASREEIEGRSVLDFNREFRGYLFSADFKRRLAAELTAEIRSLERRSQLEGVMAWRLYRANRLVTLLGGPLTGGEPVEAYMHLLATGQHWYFVNTRAWPHLPVSDDSGDIGRIFESFLRGRKVPAGTILMEDPAQIPFARILERHLGGDAAELADPVPTQEIYPQLGSLTDAAKYFRKFKDRVLKVTWSPKEKVTPKIRRHVQNLHSLGIPVSLEFSPFAVAVQPDPFVHDAMDEMLRLEPYIREFTVRTAFPALSDILTVQLEAELDEQRRLAPHRLRRTSVSRATRLKAAVPKVVESRFDLAAISKQFDPGKDAHPYRLGRGLPKADAPTFQRRSRVSQYMLFTACARAIPLNDEDAGYSDAITFFKRPRPMAEFVGEYAAEQHPQVFGFLENLVNLEVLSHL